MAQKEKVTTEFSIAASGKTGAIRIITHDTCGATFVFDSVREFLQSHADVVWGTELCRSMDSENKSVPNEEDKRCFRITTIIEQI